MAITSVGYDGSIDEVEWARLSGFLGSRHAVAGPTDWKPTIAGADRTVAIAAGAGYGDGVLDDSSAVVNLQCATVGAGSRWDAIVMNRDWQPAGGTSAFAIVQGTSTQALPTLLDDPGVEAQQPIALVKVTAGQSLLQEVIDLRTWPSKVIGTGSLLTLAGAALGTEAVVAGRRYRRELVGASVETVLAEPPRFGRGTWKNVAFVNGRKSIAHGLGFTPTVLIPSIRSVNGGVVVTVTEGPTPYTSSSVALTAFRTSDSSLYTGSITSIDYWASE